MQHSVDSQALTSSDPRVSCPGAAKDNVVLAVKEVRFELSDMSAKLWFLS